MTKAKTIALAESLGCDIDSGYDSYWNEWEITCDAPEGFVFADDHVHQFIASKNGTEPMSAGWTDIYNRLKSTRITKCPPDCDAWYGGGNFDHD